MEETLNITEDSTDYFSIIKNNQTNQPITKDAEELDNNISQEIENNAIEMDLDYFSEDNVMYTEDSEDYSQGFSLDVLEKTYLKRLQEEEEEDKLDWEIDLLTPPKIEGYVDKKTGKFVETPYIPVITAESIER